MDDRGIMYNKKKIAIAMKREKRAGLEKDGDNGMMLPDISSE